MTSELIGQERAIPGYTIEQIIDMRAKYAKAGWHFIIRILDQMIDLMEENEKLRHPLQVLKQPSEGTE